MTLALLLRPTRPQSTAELAELGATPRGREMLARHAGDFNRGDEVEPLV